MKEWRVITIKIPFDGTDGIFWRDGARYLREHGKDYALMDLAPHLESQFIMKLLLEGEQS